MSQRTEALEIISGVERRRRWRVEEKLRIVAEVEQPGVSFLDVARRYDISRGLLWNWRQQVRRGALKAAVENFQRAAGLAVDGDPGPATRAALVAALSGNANT